jgi:hypothetical protein
MRLATVLAYLVTLSIVKAALPWPTATDHVLGGSQKLIELPNYNIRYHVPDDPEIQKAGGSGGSIAVIEVRNKSNKLITSLTTQSVGGRVLETYQGFPQFEVWSRAGGGSWCRSLYRYEKKEYIWIRTDEFTDFIDFSRDKNIIAKMPKDKAVLYFVETRYPEKK